MTRDPYLKNVFRFLVGICLTIVALKVSRGYFGGFIVMFGIWSVLMKHPAWGMISFCIMPLMIILNPAVVSGMGKLNAFARTGIPLISMCMFLVATNTSSRHRLPLGTLVLFILCAFVSSMQGYMPFVSYLKIINFTFFVMGIYYGTKNLYGQPAELERLRAFFFAFALFIVIGSLWVRGNPSVGYYNSMMYYDAATANAIYHDRIAMGLSPGYFSGITNHSQCLGPMLVCIFGWVACDMLFVVKNVRKLHLFVLTLCPVFIYMTRSRTALVALIAVCVGLWIFVIPRVRMSGRFKARVVSLAFGGAVALLCVALGMEIVNHGMTRLIRKTDDVAGDTRGLTEALTESRMGLIEQGLSDFRRSPLLGMGFQTDASHPIMYQNGQISIFSAPIEKGFWPTMVLGETGLLGFGAFMVFLMTFYGVCLSKRYLVTALLFTMYLFVNLGEANIFSPGGTGGPSWMMSVVGGFVLDMVILRRYEDDRMRRRFL